MSSEGTVAAPIVVPAGTVVARRHGSMPHVTVACAGTAAALAVLALLGYVLDNDELRQLLPGQAWVKVDSAIGLLLLALSWLVPRRVGDGFAALAMLLGVVVVGEYVVGAGAGFDELLFDDPASAVHPGRPSALTLVCMIALALSRLLSFRGRGRWGQLAAFVALVVAAVALLGYLYDVRSLYSARPVTTLSVHTALGSALLAGASLAAVDGGLLTWAARGSDAGALLVRRLLPLALIGLPLIGYVCLLAWRQGWLDDVATTLALLVVACALALGYISWFAARRVSRIDRRRENTLRELGELKEDLERQVVERAGQLERHGGHIAVLEDRQRIAADLHDIVIQRLFAAGMYLQGANHPGNSPDVRDRINTAVEAMDIAIKDLRHSIFELGGGRTVGPVDLTTAVDEICTESRRILGFLPDAIVDDPDYEAEAVRDDLMAVLRESLANVARHAGATAVDVVLRAGDGLISLTITDNGKGMGTPTHNSGTRNIAERARQRGGDCTWEAAEPSGTRVRWVVPAG
ncbi:Signal transduction histidine kinase [Jatrophihabitans endophyticus]|uniref:Signal transduction histidine kinase n=1 Tax=Jatrophihabitans endophyticus TaxID=1206085 RepID=A0A1M5CSW5_9ACTN|nr:histidine kinase [Jatrophihabitans endophyticus]SHF57727.1 Signal transduction histidine kinase [Jatrophihabitans endophyticus]